MARQNTQELPVHAYNGGGTVRFLPYGAVALIVRERLCLILSLPPNPTDSGRIVVSADGKSRTVTTSTTDASGKKVNSSAVYDKQ
jgi:hypothetical protein